MMDKKWFVPHGFDKNGRPVVWMRISKFNSENMTKDIAMHFMVYLLDHVMSIAKPNVDQMVMIYDMADVGYANISMEIGKMIIEAS